MQKLFIALWLTNNGIDIASLDDDTVLLCMHLNDTQSFQMYMVWAMVKFQFGHREKENDGSSLRLDLVIRTMN